MPTGMPDSPYPTNQLDVLRHEFGFVAFAEYGTKSYGIARKALEEAARLRAELSARIEAESADAAAGSCAGRAEAAEAARDAVQAEALLLRRALIGRRVFPAGVMRAPLDERTEAIRAHWDEFRFSGPSETDRERDQVIGWLLDQMDNAGGHTALPHITDGITGDEADASATLDLTVEDIRARVAGYDAATARAEQAEARVAHLDAEALRLNRAVDEAAKQRDDWRADAYAVRAELADHLATECADAAAGQNAERAEQAEAERRAKLLDGPPAELVEAFRLNPAYAAAKVMRVDDEAKWLRARHDGLVARAEQAEAALSAVLALHRESDAQDGDWKHGPHWPCVVCHDGPWPCATRRAADATPRTALERADDGQGDDSTHETAAFKSLAQLTAEQGVQPVTDVSQLVPPPAERFLTDEEFAEWTSAWQRTAPRCSDGAAEQGDGGGGGDE